MMPLPPCIKRCHIASTDNHHPFGISFQVLEEVMQQIQTRPKGEIAVMVASHNEDTVRFTLNK
jgi:hypothetical protein